jgi:hypothetical protein
MWICGLASLLLFIFAHVAWFASFKVSLGGVNAVIKSAEVATREARDATASLRDLALTTARISLSVVHRTGRVGGYTDDEKKQYEDELVENLTRVGIPADQLKDALSEIKRYVTFDYRLCLGRALHNRGNEEQRKRWASFGGLDGYGSPDQFAEAFKELNLWSPIAAELVEDYRHYIYHGNHRRFEVWKDRQNWPKQLDDAAFAAH